MTLKPNYWATRTFVGRNPAVLSGRSRYMEGRNWMLLYTFIFIRATIIIEKLISMKLKISKNVNKVLWLRVGIIFFQWTKSKIFSVAEERNLYFPQCSKSSEEFYFNAKNMFKWKSFFSNSAISYRIIVTINLIY